MKRSICSHSVVFGLWLGACGFLATQSADAAVRGWLHWRGPQQDGTSLETGLPGKVDLEGGNLLWTYEIAGRGEAVIAGHRVYSYGYRGEGPDLREYLTCLDAETGAVQWEHGFNDFLSDTVYNRYAIGAPTVDPDTGNVFLMTSAGEFFCFNPRGRVLWRHSMMERFGMLTFPNGRRGAAVVDRDLVLHHCITSYWGADGPARDRFFAFDKRTGQLVWSSTPGTPPKDSSFSSPVLSWAHGKRVFYSGTGCGNMVCVNMRTGEPIWRYKIATGGINATPLLHAGNKVVSIHDTENLDSSESGRMVAVRLGAEAKAGAAGPVELDVASEVWRNKLKMFTSSPVIVGDRMFQVTQTGELECVDLNSGGIVFSRKLGTSQLHASPLFAEGRLYIPMESGQFHILKLTDSGVEVLDDKQLDGECLGAPTAYNGKLYVHTKRKLYCWGKKGNNPGLAPDVSPEAWPAPGQPARLQIIPSDVLLAPGETAAFRVRVLDGNGFTVEEVDASKAQWESFIPPTARVKTSMNAAFNNRGRLVAAKDPVPSAGAFKATYNGLTGILRGRVLPAIPFHEDFESFAITETQPAGHVEAGATYAYPPLPWIGARFKWEIREHETGGKVLRKTLDSVLFQRAITFLGEPDMSNYTVEADVMTDGNRRTKSNVGVINQRYFITLIGNAQLLEVSSNHDRVKVSVPFKWQQKEWYRLKARVDLNRDGSGVVRAKAWARGEEEPAAWTLEVPHTVAHRTGAPGLYGFSPQSLYPVYVDNVTITKN